MKKPENCIMVIFGASGDLTKRKLIPALFDLYQQGLLPERFAVLGVSRTEFSDSTFREHIINSLKSQRDEKRKENESINDFSNQLYYQSIDDYKNIEENEKLKARLAEMDQKLKINNNYIYYLSTPPFLYEPIAEILGKLGLNRQEDGSGWKRIIIEKPFGYDLESARALNNKLWRIFKEGQIYRIDHYLGKETVQNILVFRFSNGIFEPLWNRNFVHHIEVTSAESIGIEGRGRYYDQSGALRDMVQNHLLQIIGTVAMEPPSSFDAEAVRDEKVKVYKSLRLIKPEEVEKYVVRGQYTESTIQGDKVPGYRSEKNIKPGSRTETYVALKLSIDNWRWGGVPFYIRTGKRLPTRVTEAVFHFKKTPHHLFTHDNQSNINDNQLVIRIQPDEGILLRFGLKLPGVGFQIKNVNMDFHYSDLTDLNIPSAYERLLLDCMLGDPTLFARADSVEACWSFIMPILEAWKNNKNLKVYGYPARTWGPKEAKQLFEPGEDWHYPCKNLVSNGDYCEL